VLTFGATCMAAENQQTVLSLMLAVPNTPAAVEWYKKALGAQLLWSLGSVAGLEINGAPFFLHEPVKNGFDSPKALGATTVRVEVFVDDPDGSSPGRWRRGRQVAQLEITLLPGEPPTGRVHRPIRPCLACRGQVALSALWLNCFLGNLGAPASLPAPALFLSGSQAS